MANNGNGPLREDRKIEYDIRRYQRALGMTRKINYTPSSDPNFKSALGGEKARQEDILKYAFKIIDLKKRLYKLTGRCSPLCPKWPL